MSTIVGTRTHTHTGRRVTKRKGLIQRFSFKRVRNRDKVTGARVVIYYYMPVNDVSKRDYVRLVHS